MNLIKKIKNYIFYILLFIIFIACNKTHKISETGRILQGTHELRRFKTNTKEGYKWSASYFLIVGGGSGGTYKDTKASFSWKMNTGEYAISEIRLGKIRIKIDSTINKPYVKFNWKEGQYKNLETIFKFRINYILIICKEEDYPINIDLSKL